MSKYIDADRIRRGVEDNMLEAERFENYKDNAMAEHFRGQALAYATVLDGLDKLEQEQTEVDITMEIDKNVMKLRTVPTYDELVRFARYFFELGQRDAANKFDAGFKAGSRWLAEQGVSVEANIMDSSGSGYLSLIMPNNINNRYKFFNDGDRVIVQIRKK